VASRQLISNRYAPIFARRDKTKTKGEEMKSKKNKKKINYVFLNILFAIVFLLIGLAIGLIISAPTSTETMEKKFSKGATNFDYMKNLNEAQVQALDTLDIINSNLAKKYDSLFNLFLNCDNYENTVIDSNCKMYEHVKGFNICHGTCRFEYRGDVIILSGNWRIIRHVAPKP
jgi:hypothetical protein